MGAPTPLLLLALNPSSGVPLYRQVMDGIRELIATEVLKPGDQLPSIRELAGHLRINPSSAVKAYTELQHHRVLELDQGRGTFVSRDPQLVSQTRADWLQQQVEGLLARADALGMSAAEVVDAVTVAARKTQGRKK